jgi:hypothetical protein
MTNDYTTRMHTVMAKQLDHAETKLSGLLDQQAVLDASIHDVSRVITSIKRMMSVLALASAQPEVKHDHAMEQAAIKAVEDEMDNLTTGPAT